MKLEHHLRLVESAADWLDYHRIRRTTLFEARGRFGVYQEGHADEHLPENHPFLLIKGDETLGTIRIDLPATSAGAFFRLVAIDQYAQRQGHGTALIQLAEHFAISQGRTRGILNAAPDAIEFYQKLGYELDPQSPENNPETPRMWKDLTPPL